MYYKKNWGLTLDELEYMKRKQNYCCACCGETRDLHIDHHHGTGLIREMLCAQCNQAIGKLNDSEETVKKVLFYLEKHRASADPKTIGRKCLCPERVERT